MKQDQRLFRIVSLESFLQLILYHRERYVNPLSWEDTYEGCALRLTHDKNRIIDFIDALFSEYQDENDCGDIVLYNFAKAEIARDFNFGQCWSLNEDSDAMWRIYSYGKHSIQIESSPESLFKCIDKQIDEDTALLPRIRSVKYDVKPTDKESAYIRFYQRGMDFSESFFHKREAFRHESEVRILYRPEYTQYEFSSNLNRYRRKLKELNNSQSQNITKDLLVRVIHQIQSETPHKNSQQESTIYLKVNNLSQYIKNIKVHPMAESWYVDLVERICKDHHIRFGGRSSLYDDA